ncbi:MAG: DinB family protein [Halofilum sp. (in: g-proteobacteria)]|nr:DinB family protein [Halofilum sp. (in: g-proteobacteria)]
MIDREYCVTLARYNRWMNERLYAICAGIDDATRRRDMGAFFRSIHGTLNHLLWGDLVWLSRFTGRERPATAIDEPVHDDFETLRVARASVDAEILDWARRIDPEWLAAPFTWFSGVDRSEHKQPAWILVTHLFQHQVHHRGQLTTLLMQLGHDPGVTDLPWLPHSAAGDA